MSPNVRGHAGICNPSCFNSLNPAQVCNNQRCRVWRLLGTLCEMSWPPQIRSYSKVVHQNVTTADGSNLPFCQQYQQASQRLNEHSIYNKILLGRNQSPKPGNKRVDVQDTALEENLWSCSASHLQLL